MNYNSFPYIQLPSLHYHPSTVPLPFFPLLVYISQAANRKISRTFFIYFSVCYSLSSTIYFKGFIFSNVNWERAGFIICLFCVDLSFFVSFGIILFLVELAGDCYFSISKFFELMLLLLMDAMIYLYTHNKSNHNFHEGCLVV